MRLLLSIILLVVCCHVYGMGFSDWREVTPNGTVFDDPGGYFTITLANGEIYPNRPDRWYFYHDHIIGHMTEKTVSTGTRTTTYFIIDEIEGEIREFQDKLSWQQVLTRESLQPWIWTRWHWDNWNHMKIVVFWLIFGFPLTIPLIGFNIYWIYKAFKSKRDYGIRRWTVRAAIFPLILLMIYGLSNYPGSI